MRARGRTIFVTAIFYMGLAGAHAQDASERPFFLRFGGPGNAFVADIATGPDDGFIVAGGFSETMSLSDGAGAPSLTSVRGLDVFVARFDARGQTVWSARIGDRMNDAASAVACDEQGNVFVGGYFSGKCDFGTAEKPLTRHAVGRRDAWVARFAPDGMLLWATSLGGTDDDEVRDIAADGAGGCLVTGYVTGLADIDTRPGSMLADARGGRDGFVIHLNADGVFQWGSLIGGGGDDESVAIVRAGGGEMGCLGSFSGTMVLESVGRAPIKLTSAGKRDVFVARIDADHALQSAVSFGSSGEDVAAALALDREGNLLATGRFEATARFDQDKTLRSAGGTDGFVARIDSKDNITVFPIGGTRHDGASAIACADDGTFAVTGSFAGRADFDPGPQEQLLKARSQRPLAFLAFYRSTQDCLRASALGESKDRGNRSASPAVSAASICFDRQGRCIVAGQFAGASDLLVGEDLAPIESEGASDGFVLRLPAGWQTHAAVKP